MSASQEDLKKFYSGREDNSPSIFDVWEQGAARGDSVTPSTYSHEYREMMLGTLVEALAKSDARRLLSLGCGNAVIEAELAAQGYDVLAVDAMPEAVRLARRKGLTSLLADVREWSPAPGEWPVVYADGLFGHLYDPDTRTLPILHRIRSWFTDGGTLIASNDSTRSGEPAEAAPGVNAFYWLSEDYLADQAYDAGFSFAECRTFTYSRPISGPRHRSVLIAQTAA
ncbi:class I SAM-dependent methyltransferase [Streptomyces jumonjinensis]|uniref:class I SAM-dependent methyltransferase n=1 Tax=Streptomyces jumonjinensis TaxID=1945 RepID=UPI002B1F8DE3|nr:methyltransferase domain-containing protein [Streptomyces jumonjinensis]